MVNFYYFIIITRLKMVNLSIKENYNLSSSKMLILLVDEKFCKFVVDNQEDLLEFYYTKIDKSVKNKLVTTSISKFNLNLPPTLKHILPNTYTITTDAEYDLINKTVFFKVNSKIIDLIKGDFSYNYSLKDIVNEKCQRTINFNFNCNIPIFGKKIEKLMIDNINKTNLKRYKLVEKWILLNKK